MNREQIIKALECCAEQEVCGTCPFEGKCGGMEYLLDNALSLIREQEKRIEALTLEYAGFEAGAKAVERFIKSDTVRKMAEMIEDHCIKGGIYPAFVSRAIEQIVKEMLDGAESFGIMDGIKKRMEQDTCVSCGNIIPEGRQVCPNCQGGENE